MSEEQLLIDDEGRALLSAFGRIAPHDVERLGIDEVLRRCERFLADLQRKEMSDVPE